MIRGFSANLNTLYADLSETDRCLAAASDGFRCVEMWALPEPEGAERMIATLRQHQLWVASINTSQGRDPDDFGLASEPVYTGRWREQFRAVLGFSHLAKAGAINVLVGGRRPSATRQAQRRCLLDNLEWALTEIGDRGPTLLLEPLNGADRRSPLLQTVADAQSVMAELGRPSNLRLLFDAYHLFQEEDDLIQALNLAADVIGHVQLADYPGRAEPGTGELPVARFLAELEHIGYSGWVGLEYFPSGTEGSPFGWLRHYEALDDRRVPGIAR